MNGGVAQRRTDGLQALSVAQKQFFDGNGYLILPGFFDAARVAEAKAHIGDLWADRAPSNPLVVDYFGPPVRAYLRDTDAAVRDRPYKLNDVHLCDKVFQNLSLDPRLVQVLRDVLGAQPMACNTLLMERGSQQAAHFDTFYMPSPTPNMMCASWIALDPVTDANGPLFYYPKSHLIPPFRFSSGGLHAIGAEMADAKRHMAQIIAEHGLQEERFYPQPGDVLIWHAQLLHGGSPITDLEQTRTSLVTHYWTTLDFPDPAGWVVLGPGRILQRRGHQHVAGGNDTAEVDAFVAALRTPRKYCDSAPPDFDPRGYLLRNMDVFGNRADPYVHYALHGRAEGRGW